MYRVFLCVSAVACADSTVTIEYDQMITFGSWSDPYSTVTLHTTGNEDGLSRAFVMYRMMSLSNPGAHDLVFDDDLLSTVTSVGSENDGPGDSSEYLLGDAWADGRLLAGRSGMKGPFGWGCVIRQVTAADEDEALGLVDLEYEGSAAQPVEMHRFITDISTSVALGFSSPEALHLPCIADPVQ